MRRIAAFVLVVAILLLATVAVGLGSRVFAQEATPAARGEHPLVGTWLLDTNADDQNNAPEVTIFTADGAYLSVDAEGVPNHGVWEATGERRRHSTAHGRRTGVRIVGHTGRADAPHSRRIPGWTPEAALGCSLGWAMAPEPGAGPSTGCTRAP